MMQDDLERRLIGSSLVIRGVRDLIRRFAPTNLNVLVQGPTGVGKELVAQALHALSGRTGELVSVNSAAIPDTMFEAEMFGHARGAFSGAVQDRLGFLAEANGGTLFLDEVGSLPLGMQPKLLRALDSRRYRPVGARGDRFSDFRVIAAANEELERRMTAGCFRADLYHRLRVAVIAIAPLDARPDDIPALAHQFAAEITRNGQLVSIAGDAVDHLVRRPWPGNVRELRHVIHCAAAVATSARITSGDLLVVAGLESRSVPFDAVARSERDELVDALSRNAWQVARTADALHMHRVTLSRRMGRLGIKRPPRHEREIQVAKDASFTPIRPISAGRPHELRPEASAPHREA
jgi:two-component system NtrC family response regulator